MPEWYVKARHNTTGESTFVLVESSSARNAIDDAYGQLPEGFEVVAVREATDDDHLAAHIDSNLDRWERRLDEWELESLTECRECGKPIPQGSSDGLCRSCAALLYGEEDDEDA